MMITADEFRKIGRYRKYLFALLCLVYMLPFIQNFIMTVVAKDVMRDMSLSPDRMGLLGSSYLIGYAVSMLLSGMLAAWFGPRLFLSGMFFLAGAGGLVFAWTESFYLACLARVACGMGSAVVLTSALTLFARWYKAESFSILCAVFFSVGGMGSFLGAAPVAVMNAAWGWRICFFIVAALTLFYAVLVILTVRDWPPPGAEELLGVAAAPRAPVTLGAMWDGVKRMSRNADFWRLALWFVGMSGISLSYVGLWAGPFLKDVYRLEDARIGLILSVFSVGFIVGNPALSWLCEKKLRSNRIGLFGAAVLGFVAMLPLFLLGDRLGFYSHLTIALGMGLALNAPNALIYSSARNIFGSRLAGMASGALASTCFVSGAVLQVVCGLVLHWAELRDFSTRHGYLLAFSPFILCYAVAAVSGFTLSRDSDPGHVSPLSWRMILKKNEDAR